MNREKMIHQLDRSLPDQKLRYFGKWYPNGHHDRTMQPDIVQFCEDFKRMADRKYADVPHEILVDREDMIEYNEWKVCVYVRFIETIRRC